MRSRNNSCTRKIRYPTHADAMRGLRRTAEMNLAVYACGRCGGFHLGHEKGPHHTRGTYYGGRRYERLLAAIDAAVRS